VSHIVWITPDRFVSNDWSGVVNSWTRTSTGIFALSATWNTGGQSLGIAVSPDKTRLAVGGAGVVSSGATAVEGFEFLAL